jgi:uncharacterized protein YukE
MYVEVETVRESAPSFEGLADRIEGVFVRLAGELDARAGCWGSDAVGTRFAQAYQPAAGQVRDSLPGLRDGVREVARELRLVAENAGASDARAAARIG